MGIELEKPSWKGKCVVSGFRSRSSCAMFECVTGSRGNQSTRKRSDPAPLVERACSFATVGSRRQVTMQHGFTGQAAPGKFAQYGAHSSPSPFPAAQSTDSADLLLQHFPEASKLRFAIPRAHIRSCI